MPSSPPPVLSQVGALEHHKTTSESALEHAAERVRQLEGVLVEARRQTADAEGKLVDAEEHYSKQVGWWIGWVGWVSWMGWVSWVSWVGW